jgi:hypothetical protein
VNSVRRAHAASREGIFMALILALNAFRRVLKQDC